jgi:hypothetical protein
VFDAEVAHGSRVSVGAYLGAEALARARLRNLDPERRLPDRGRDLIRHDQVRSGALYLRHKVICGADQRYLGLRTVFPQGEGEHLPVQARLDGHDNAYC